MKRTVELINLPEITIDEGGAHTKLHIVLEVEWETENYGMDADGNRGLPTDFVADYKISGIFDVDTGEELTDSYEDHGDVQLVIQKWKDA